MLTRQELEKSPLFADISYEDYLRMLDCFQAVQKTFRPDELIYDFSSNGGNAVGIIERGEALLIRIDEEGVSTAFAGSSADSLQVVCRTPCDVLFIDYPHILKRCERACTHHSLLVQNMLRLMAGKAQGLSERVDVLSRRSIREKLLCYFHQLSDKAGSLSFTLPFSLSTLADYIATDRSAMMRELKRMREEGLLQSDGRRFTLSQ